MAVPVQFEYTYPCDNLPPAMTTIQELPIYYESGSSVSLKRPYFQKSGLLLVPPSRRQSVQLMDPITYWGVNEPSS